MRRVSQRSLVAALASCLALGTTLTGPASAAPEASAGVADTTMAMKARPTQFALSGNSFGTQVVGGQVPAASGRTAHSWVSCTTLAGKERRNSVAGVDLAGQGTVGAVTTRTWTKRKQTADGVVVSSHSLTTVADVAIGPLELGGVRLKTRAWHDSDGFHADRKVRLLDAARIPGLPPLPELPTPDQIDIPGLGSLTILGGRQGTSAHRAWVNARGLQIKIAASDTTVTIGNAYSSISDQTQAGVMRGWGRAANVRALDGVVTTGQLAPQQMPCGGTNGKWKQNATVGLDLAGQLVIGAASGAARGKQIDRRNAVAMTRGEIARVNLAGQLVITGIRAKATVRRVDGRLKRSIKGTTVGSITFNGEEQELPLPGETQEIPGLGTITIAKRIKPKRTNAVHVIAVQVKLLGDTPGATTINLGEAKVALTEN
jgi:hypothetical protein